MLYDWTGDALSRIRRQPMPDSRGILTAYAYDAEKRLLSKTYSDSTPTVTYYYDQTSYNGLTITNGKGHRTGMSDGSGQTAWSYNTVGQVVAERRTIGTVTKATSYAYNTDATLQSIVYPGGRYVGYSYDLVGEPTGLAEGTNQYVGGATYGPQQALASVVLASDLYYYGDAVTYSYDSRLRPSETKVTSQAGSVTPLDLSYAYWENSNLLRLTNKLVSGRTVTYSYDSLNRLSLANTQATSGGNCWGQSFGYDRYANLLSIIASQCSPPTLSLTVNLKNRIINTGYVYDNAGNLTSNGSLTYAWDAENHLQSVAGVSYTYDGDGKRVKKSNGTLYWYSISGQVLEETDLSGNLTSDYMYFNGRRVVRRDSGGQTYAFLADPLGSTRMMTDGNGNIVRQADYYPFGGERVITSTVDTHYKFAGMERDAESSLDHTLYRQYTSSLGRWLSPDPVGGDITNPQSLNRYAYVLNNPTTFIDPQGTHLFLPCMTAEGGGCNWGDPNLGGGGGSICTIDGVSMPCPFGTIGLNGMTNVTGTDTTPRYDPRNGQWWFFGCFADGSCGFLPGSLTGWSVADIFNAKSAVSTESEGTRIDPKNLTGGAAATYQLLVTLGVNPANMKIYKNGGDNISFVLTPEAFAALNDSITQNFGDTALHYPYTNGGRDSSPTNSLHIVWFDPNLTSFFGGIGVYIQGHVDADNPWTGSMAKHLECTLFKTGCAPYPEGP
jgi:RHS repeat-associated protein